MKSIQKTLNIPALFLLICMFSVSPANAAERYYYQLKIYHLKTETQERRLDSYLQNAYLPAMHRMGVKSIGVFKPIDKDTSGQRVYVLTPFRTWDQLEKVEQTLSADNQYETDGKDYIEAAYNDMPYTRIEIIILRAFPKMLMPAVPVLTAPKTDRVYELRSYESPTEKYNINKVKMFNDGNEVALFKRLGFNAVFYAEVIAGSHMPNLMYMTTFNSKADRDKHWEAFSGSPEWKVLSAAPEYQHNVSKNVILFVHPTAYSDF
ncbi:NIPSNAP family protein [soil metagenome]|jgi:hypothetical protein